MTDLPKHFRSVVLGVGDNHPEKDNITFLMARAAEYVAGSEATKRLDKYLDGLSDEKQLEVRQMIDEVVVERMQRQAVAARTQEVVLPTVPVPAVTPSPKKRTAEEASLSEEQPAKKKANNNMDEKKDLQDMSTEEKVRTMVGWHQKRKENGPYTNAAKDFFKKCINPVVQCLHNHCSGDMEAFTKKYPTFTHSTFTKRCCKGRGDSCSL